MAGDDATANRRGRRWVVWAGLAVVALAAAFGLRAAGRPGPGEEPTGRRGAVPFAGRVEPPTEGVDVPIVFEAGVRAIHDRQASAVLRARILANLERQAHGEHPGATNRETMPQTANGGVDPAYIQGVVRAEVMPMAGKCYEELLVRSPRAGGRIVLDYTILGGKDLGGVVDFVEVRGDADGGLTDEKLVTCLRESMTTVVFRPPPGDGIVTVTYPLELWPDDPDEVPRDVR